MSSLTAVRDPLVPTGIPPVAPEAICAKPVAGQLLVRVHHLVPASSEGSSGEDGVGEGDQEDGHRCRQERAQVRTRHIGPPERRQPAGHRTGDCDAGLLEVQRPGDTDAQHDEHQGGGDATGGPTEAHRQQRRGTAPRPPPSSASASSEAARGCRPAPRIAPSSSLDTPTSLPSWPRTSTPATPVMYPDEHRLREVVGDPAEADQPSHEEDRADPAARASPPARRTPPLSLAASGAIAVRDQQVGTVPSGPITSLGARSRTPRSATTGQHQGVEACAHRSSASWA